MIPRLVRTKDELKAARQVLGLSAEGLVAMVRMGDGRTVRRWESGESEIPGPVTVILETALDFLRQKEEIRVQLEMLKSGAMRSGAMTMSWGGVQSEDTTAKDIVRLKEAEASLKSALAILTRQPPIDGSRSAQVHWYNLRRLTYEHKPGQRDEWSLPGETSPERALAYFEKDGRFGIASPFATTPIARPNFSWSNEKCCGRNSERHSDCGPGIWSRLSLCATRKRRTRRKQCNV